MEKSYAVIVLFVSALCFSSALARKSPDWAQVSRVKFFVEGKIYHDPCHFEIETRLSTPLAGVNLTLECAREDTGDVTYTRKGMSDANGQYSIPVHGDHEEGFCRVIAHPNSYDRIVLTRNTGASSLARYVNPLGFMTQMVDPQCALVSNELALDHHHLFG